MQEDEPMRCVECGREIHSKFSLYKRDEGPLCLECLAKRGGLSLSDFVYLEIGGAVLVPEDCGHALDDMLEVLQAYKNTGVGSLQAEGVLDGELAIRHKWRLMLWEEERTNEYALLGEVRS